MRLMGPADKLEIKQYVNSQKTTSQQNVQQNNSESDDDGKKDISDENIDEGKKDIDIKSMETSADDESNLDDESNMSDEDDIPPNLLGCRDLSEESQESKQEDKIAPGEVDSESDKDNSVKNNYFY